jgi:hypothetical protein
MPRNVRKQNHFATLKKPWTQLNAPFQTLHFHFAALTHAETHCKHLTVMIAIILISDNTDK